jgi:hypothetical protein
LLWDTAVGRVVMIDHNLAYNDRLNGTLFMDTHVFGTVRAILERAAHDAFWKIEP